MTQYKGYMQSDQGALSSLYNAIQALDDIKEIDGFDSLYDQLYDLYYKIDDVNESILDIYLQLDYDPTAQNEEGLKKIIEGTFLEKGYSDQNDTQYGGSYIKVIMEAARQSDVNPYVIAATIRQEQV